MARFIGLFQDSLGNAVGSATVRVDLAGTTTLASIYSDAALVTPLANPFTANADGTYAFYAAGGLYKITVSKTGYTTRTEDDVELVDRSEHPLLAGISGGTILYGSPTSGENLEAHSNPSEDGLIDLGPLVVNEATGRVGVGTSTPAVAFQVVGGDLRLDAGQRIYLSTDVSIARHVAGDGFTLRQESAAALMKLSLMRTDGQTGSVPICNMRGEGIDDAAGSYDAGGLVIQQISNVAGAEKTQIRFSICDGTAAPVEFMRLNQIGTFAVFQDLTVGSSAGSYGGGKGVFFQAVSTTSPSSAPVGGVIFDVADVAASAELFAHNEAGERARVTGNLAVTTSNFTKAADTTLADITGLTRNLEAGKTYRFVIRIPHSVDTTGGYKVQLSGTATATFLVAHWYRLEAAGGITLSSKVSSLGHAAVAEATPTASDGLLKCEGTIVVATGGTLTVKFAQNSASGSSTADRGSTLEIME